MRNTCHFGSSMTSSYPSTSPPKILFSAETCSHQQQQYNAAHPAKPPKPPVRRRFAKAVLKSPISLKHGWLSNCPHMFWKHARDARYEVAENLSTWVQVEVITNKALLAWALTATPAVNSTILSLRECESNNLDIRHEVVRRISRIASASSLGITDGPETPTSQTTKCFSDWLPFRHGSNSVEPQLMNDNHSSNSSNNSQGGGTRQQSSARNVEPRSIHIDAGYYQLQSGS